MRIDSVVVFEEIVEQIRAILDRRGGHDWPTADLAIRVPTGAIGVALNGKSLPNLPPSMVEVMGTSKRTGVQPMGGALVRHHATQWVVQGSESVRFVVSKNKRALSGAD